jgi:hypothetical protein
MFSPPFNKRIVYKIVAFEIHLQGTGNRNFVGLIPPCLLVTSSVLCKFWVYSTNIANVGVHFPGDSRDWNVKIRLILQGETERSRNMRNQGPYKGGHKEMLLLAYQVMEFLCVSLRVCDRL